MSSNLSIHPPFPSLQNVHMSHLYFCFSIPALQIDSSHFFLRFHIYALIHNICFSLSDSSLCPADSRSIHIATDVFLIMDPSQKICQMLLHQLNLCHLASPGFLPHPISSLTLVSLGRELVSASVGIYRASLPGGELQLSHGPVA